METLKLKFKLHALEFEIEGREQIVREEFKDFKEFTQQLAGKIDILQVPETLAKTEDDTPKLLTDFEPLPDEGYPGLKDLVMMNLPKTEFEWVLIYAFYQSSFGTTAFTRDKLLAKYRESGRYTDNRIKKFSENFKSLVSKQLIKSKNDQEYILLIEGKQKAIEILKGEQVTKNNKTKTTAKTANKKTTSGSSTKEKPCIRKNDDVTILDDLNLRPSGKISLKDYAREFVIGSNEEMYLVIVYYLKEILKIDNITLDHIHTCLIELDKRTPSHLYQTLINIKNKSSEKWLQLDNLNDIKFSIRGMNHLKFDIKKAKDK